MKQIAIQLARTKFRFEMPIDINRNGFKRIIQSVLFAKMASTVEKDDAVSIGDTVVLD